MSVEIPIEELSVEALKAGLPRYPKVALAYVEVRFVSATGAVYHLGHVAETQSEIPYGHKAYLRLSSPDKNRHDFAMVEGLLQKITDGIPENRVSNRGHDICDIIDMERTGKDVTPKLVGRFLEAYQQHFQSVTIVKALKQY